MKKDTVLLEKRDGVAWVTLNRPDRLNAYNVAMRDDLFAALNAVSQVLLHKFSKQAEAPQGVLLPVAIPMEPTAPDAQKLPA